MALQRFKLTIAYRGTHYHGWQTQAANRYYKGKTLGVGKGIPTIQEILRYALQRVVKHEVRLVGSSRTDAGVHAKAQVAHFDTNMVQIPPEGLRLAANSRLPDDIIIRSAEAVPQEFDAIASTVSKRYQYAIWNADDRPVFFSELAWNRRKVLDVDAMAEATKYFVGQHDFASFCQPGHKREHTVRRVLDCRLSRRGRGPLIVIGVEGEGFLWRMIRIMVGTLVDIGLGQFKPEDIPKMIAAKDRRAAGGTAPPCGLYLQWIKYGTEGLTNPTVGSAEEPRTTPE